jgi:hypothetical protein
MTLAALELRATPQLYFFKNPPLVLKTKLCSGTCKAQLNDLDKAALELRAAYQLNF